MQFLGVANGSLREIETQLHVAVRLQYATQVQTDGAFALAAEAGRLIYGLRNSLAG